MMFQLPKNVSKILNPIRACQFRSSIKITTRIILFWVTGLCGVTLASIKLVKAKIWSNHVQLVVHSGPTMTAACRRDYLIE